MARLKKMWLPLVSSRTISTSQVNFDILSDRDLSVAKVFGVKKESGLPARAAFITDNQRKVRHCSVTARSVREDMSTKAFTPPPRLSGH